MEVEGVTVDPIAGRLSPRKEERAIDQRNAKKFLGLAPDASAAEVELAYTKRSRVHKRFLIQAKSVDHRERHRNALRELISVRDIALGPDAAEARRRTRRARSQKGAAADDWLPGARVPTGLAREEALAFLGLKKTARAGDVRGAFHARSRALKRLIAHASTDDELQRFRTDLARLNRLLRTALEGDEGGRVLTESTATRRARGGLAMLEPPPASRPKKSPKLYDTLPDDFFSAETPIENPFD